MTDQLRAAAQQALEALENFARFQRMMRDGPDASDKLLAEDYAEAGFLQGAKAIPALRAALEEQPAEQEPVAWMPIATAPKGRIVLVHYKNSLGNGRTMRARYYLPETLDSDTTESGWADEGWYEESEAYEYLMPLDHEPTHWMPLPAAPDTAPQPTKQPLTDEEIDQMWSDAHNDTSAISLVKVFARAIERAHGINVPQARGEQE